MAVIHIDGKQVKVDGADNLLEACLSLGIDVPYFCYHPALGSVGSCRQCAVKQYQNEEDYKAGKGRLVMSCMVAPSENMYISVDDAEAKAFRQSIIEFLMTNHPHDCPTCEEGGHCHLQDMTYMSGHNQRRYRFSKRTHHNQELGPFIAHEMNRCIACYRCVRFYKDYAGGEDLGVYASNNRVYFGRDKDGQFESEFSGNLTEVCPTGVFTDKTHSQRYNRKWDMQYAPSICHGCSSGCNISPGERYGELRRIENRYNGEVNRYFLCDLGRFGYGYVNRDDRPIQPIERINNKHVKINIDYALDGVIKRLQGKKVIGIGSPRASLETNYALKKLVGFNNFSTGLNTQQQTLIQKCIDVLTTQDIYNPSMAEIEDYDAIFILGEDITQTSARVALAVRQAAKNKAVAMAHALKTQKWLAEPVKRIGQNNLSPVYVVDAVQTKLDDISKVSCVATPEDIYALGFAVADAIKGCSEDINEIKAAAKCVDCDAQDNEDPLHNLAAQIAYDLVMAKKPLIISGTSLFNEAIIDSAAQVTQVLTQKRRAIRAYQRQKIEAHNEQISKMQQQNRNVDNSNVENNDEQPNNNKELAAKPDKTVSAAKNAPKNKDTPGDTAENKQLLKNELLQEDTDYDASAAIYLCVPDANSIGVCLLGGESVESILAIDFDVVIVAENQLTDAINIDKLVHLLNDKIVIALDHQFLSWYKFVDLILPAASFAEADGTLISAEGRAQRFFQVYDSLYYHPNSSIKEGWRWLHAIETSLSDMPLNWTQLDDVITDLVKTHPNLKAITQAAPDADFRISGLKIAREPRRYSGRTAMRAPISVHEPMQPKDKDTALTFSMEGYTGDKTPSALIPFASSPGWNSPQAWNKLQDKVGGHLKQGDPGIRLFDLISFNDRLAHREYIAPTPSKPIKSSIFHGKARLIPVYNLFASSPMAYRSPIVASQLPEAVFTINTNDGANWQLSEGDWLSIETDGIHIELPIKLVPYFAEGCIGYPVGQVPIVHPNLPASVAKITPPQHAMSQKDAMQVANETNANTTDMTTTVASSPVSTHSAKQGG